MKALAASYTRNGNWMRSIPMRAQCWRCFMQICSMIPCADTTGSRKKNQAAFFRSLERSLSLQFRRVGYICFSLSSDEFGGTEVPAGFPLRHRERVKTATMCSSRRRTKRVCNAVKTLKRHFLIDGGNDRIQCIYEDREEVGIQNDPIYRSSRIKRTVRSMFSRSSRRRP